MTWTDALNRQRVLQEALARVQGARPNALQLELAAKEELAELLQKVKARWAWWKRNDKDFTAGERGEVLEELADVLHFVLGWFLVEGRKPPSEPPQVFDLVQAAVQGFRALNPEQLFLALRALARSLGLTDDEVLVAYMRKSAVNLERWGAR